MSYSRNPETISYNVHNDQEGFPIPQFIGAPTFKYNMFREVSWLPRVTHDFVTNAVGEKNLIDVVTLDFKMTAR